MNQSERYPPLPNELGCTLLQRMLFLWQLSVSQLLSASPQQAGLLRVLSPDPAHACRKPHHRWQRLHISAFSCWQLLQPVDASTGWYGEEYYCSLFTHLMRETTHLHVTQKEGSAPEGIHTSQNMEIRRKSPWLQPLVHLCLCVKRRICLLRCHARITG